MKHILWLPASDFEKIPLETFRKVGKGGAFFSWIIRVFAFGVLYVEEEQWNVDYSEYLGKDYKAPENFNTIISNHSSYFDIFYFLPIYWPAFVSKAEIKQIPFFGYFTTALRSIYIEWEKGKDEHQ